MQMSAFLSGIWDPVASQVTSQGDRVLRFKIFISFWSIFESSALKPVHPGRVWKCFVCETVASSTKQPLNHFETWAEAFYVLFYILLSDLFQQAPVWFVTRPASFNEKVSNTLTCQLFEEILTSFWLKLRGKKTRRCRWKGGGACYRGYGWHRLIQPKRDPSVS